MTALAEAARRRTPRPWDTDWLVLGGLAKVLDRLVAARVDRGDRLLDFGCGSMPYRSMIEAAGATYIGADLDADAAMAIGVDGALPAADGAVEVVLSVQVLEHVRDLDRYLGEARRVLADDGTLLLSTHGTWLYHPHPEDHRRWTRTGLIHDIETRGFRVDSIHPVAGPLATTTLIRLTGFAYALRGLPLVGGLLVRALAVAMNARALVEDRLTPAAMIRDNACVYVVACTKVAA